MVEDFLHKVMTDGGSEKPGIKDKPVEVSEQEEKVLRGIEQDFHEWSKSREEHEATIRKRKEYYEKDLAKKAKSIEKKLGEAEKSDEKEHEEYTKNPERGSHSFQEYNDLGLSSFLEELSEDVEDAYRNYQARGNKIIELKDQLDELDKANMRETLERPENKNLSISDVIKGHLSRFTSIRTDEDREEDWQNLLSERRAEKKSKVEESIDRHLENSREDHEVFAEYFDEVEQTYETYAADVENYLDQAVPDLRTTTAMIETLSRVDVLGQEGLEQEHGKEDSEAVKDYGKIIEDRDEELKRKYRDAVTSLEEKALAQYRDIENAVEEVEEVENSMSDQHFKDLKRSNELREELTGLSEEPYEEHIESLVERSLDRKPA